VNLAEKLQRLETLVQEAEGGPDPAVRAQFRQLVQALLDLHATGMERMLELIADKGETGGAILDECAADEVVSGLLLLHGLHPLSLEDRVQQALGRVQPLFDAHGVDLELMELDEATVRLRLEGTCPGDLRAAIEEAFAALAPDATVELEGLEEASVDGRIALPVF
jgi:Fe-S cluster biogenesis protein NfuA